MLNPLICYSRLSILGFNITYENINSKICTSFKKNISVINVFYENNYLIP